MNAETDKMIEEGVVPMNTRRKMERDLEIEIDDDYILNLQKWWDLKNPEEKEKVSGNMVRP